MASPLLVPPALIVTFDNASRASSLSLVNRAMTLIAASCWYSAVANSCRVWFSCCLIVKDSSAKASHSFWNVERRDGMDVRVGGRGATILKDLRSIRSATSNSSPFTGSLWFSAI